MTVQPIEVNTPHSSDILGFDASRMFTTDGENAELRAQLAWPHDACTVLAQETAGTVWTTSDREASMLTLPAETMSARLAEQVTGRTCLSCECDSFELAARTVCYPCEVPTPVSLSGNSFFNVPYIQLRNTIRKAQKTFGKMDVWVV